MRAVLPVPILVERQIEEQLAATRSAAGGQAHADALAFSFTSDHPYIGTLKGHVHAGLEIGIVLTGEIEVFFPGHFTNGGGESSRRATAGGEGPGYHLLACSPGCVWLCNAWEPHAWRVNVPGTVNLAFLFLPELLGCPRHTLLPAEAEEPPLLGLFTVPPHRRPRVSGSALQRRILAIGNDLQREMQEKPPFWQAKVRLDLLRILLELARVPGDSLGEQDPAAVSHGAASEGDSGPPPAAVNRILPALKLAYLSPSRRVSVAEAAEACALSASRFHHLFRRTMGVSFGTFCLHARLAFVAHQLLYTEHSVGAIAEEAGFVDVSHLCHVFGKHYGCTPSEYRQGQIPVG